MVNVEVRTSTEPSSEPNRTPVPTVIAASETAKYLPQYARSRMGGALEMRRRKLVREGTNRLKRHADRGKWAFTRASVRGFFVLWWNPELR